VIHRTAGPTSPQNNTTNTFTPTAGCPVHARSLRMSGMQTASPRIYLTLLTLLLCLFTQAITLHAQVGTATVTGTVQDVTGAVIPGAIITLTDVDTQTKRISKSDSGGFFSIPNLPAKTYSATFHMPGFADLVRRNIVIHIGDQASIPNIKMQLETAKQTITVTAESDSIQPTTSGESAYTLSSKQIQNLDIQGRSAIELLGLVPGAANSGNFSSDSYSGQTAGFSQNGSAFSVNGNRFDLTQIVSDGATVTDVNSAGGSAVTPNVDMIAEAKVETAAFLPENPNGPIVVNTETKSGGREVHGELYASARNHIFNDTDWRVKNLGLAKPDDAYYYPGANISGPIYVPGHFNKNLDKLFFFVAFEKAIQYVQDPLLDIRETVTPTAAMRMGDFSNTAYLQSLNMTNSYYATVTPCNTTQAPGANPALCTTPGIINPTAIDPNGQVLINALPLPNANPLTSNGYNLISAATTFQPRDQESVKIDYNIDPRDHLSVRYNHESESVPFPFGYYNTFTEDEFPAGQYGHNTSQSLVGNLATSVTPSLTNQLIASYTQLGFKTYLHNETAISRAALHYTAADLYNNDTDILPNVQPGYGGGGYASIYLIGGSYPTVDHPQQTFVVNETLSKVFKTHSIKGGFYFARQQFSELTPGQENSAIETGEYAGSFNTGNAFADLLTGQIAGYSQSTKNFVGNMMENRYDFFLQDEWKITPRFTLNYGTRVNHIGAWYETSGRIVVFNPALYSAAGTYAQAPGLVTHATNSATSISGGIPLSFKLAPDVGFAYDIFGTGTTILRGGFGTNDYPDPGSNAFSTIQAPPNETFTSVFALSTISAIPTLQTYLPLGLYGIGNRNDNHLPVTHSYTLAVDQSYGHGLSTELAYSGNGSKYLTGFINTNPVPEGCAAEYPNYMPPMNGNPATVSYAPNSFNDVSCRQYSLLSGLSTEVHNLSSFYNSLQASASKKTGIVNFWLTYTYGKTLSYNCENPFNERRCYGPPPFDRSQTINLSYLINLPSVSAKYLGNHKPLNAILDGWQFTGIETFASGDPIEFTAAASANGNTGNEYDGLHNRTITFYGQYTKNPNPSKTYVDPNFDNRNIVGTPDEQAAPTLICNPTANLHAHQYFNAACFASPVMGAPNAPSIGSYHLPYIHGPRLQVDDIGLYKSFKFTSARSVQFRAQAFNVFNHPQDAFIQYDPGLELVYDSYGAAPVNPKTFGSPSPAGYATTKLGARTIQLEAKLFF
jgi:hypothetical protein